MGSTQSKGSADPCIYITFRNEAHPHTIVIRKFMDRGGMITVCDMTGYEAILFEFEKDKVDAAEVWRFVVPSVMKNMKDYPVAYVSNNFRCAYAKVEFTDKTVDDMQVLVQELVAFMIKAASLFAHKQSTFSS